MIRLFRLILFDSVLVEYIPRNLSISSRLSNFWQLIVYSIFYILKISTVLVISPLSFLI